MRVGTIFCLFVVVVVVFCLFVSCFLFCFVHVCLCSFFFEFLKLIGGGGKGWK